MFDTHVHFDAAPFAGHLDETVRRAADAGVEGWLNPAVDLPSSRRVLGIHRAHPRVRPCVGIHPLYLDGLATGWEAELETLAGGAVAIGEAGLDFWHGRENEERQREVLLVQARLARRLGLPLVLHIRKSFYDTLALLREAGFEGTAICHAFSGSWDMAAKALDRGFYLSAAANLTWPGRDKLAEVFRRAPAERLLVETDAPDIPPWTRRGEVHNPWDLPAVVEAFAAARGEPIEKTARRTRDNALRLFPPSAGEKD